jgi:hypothetical protein
MHSRVKVVTTQATEYAVAVSANGRIISRTKNIARAGAFDPIEANRIAQYYQSSSAGGWILTFEDVGEVVPTSQPRKAVAPDEIPV